jgi:hypothetical protein
MSRITVIALIDEMRTVYLFRLYFLASHRTTAYKRCSTLTLLL